MMLVKPFQSIETYQCSLKLVANSVLVDCTNNTNQHIGWFTAHSLFEQQIISYCGIHQLYFHRCAGNESILTHSIDDRQSFLSQHCLWRYDWTSKCGAVIHHSLGANGCYQYKNYIAWVTLATLEDTFWHLRFSKQ